MCRLGWEEHAKDRGEDHTGFMKTDMSSQQKRKWMCLLWLHPFFSHFTFLSYNPPPPLLSWEIWVRKVQFWVGSDRTTEHQSYIQKEYRRISTDVQMYQLCSLNEIESIFILISLVISFIGNFEFCVSNKKM